MAVLLAWAFVAYAEYTSPEQPRDEVPPYIQDLMAYQPSMKDWVLNRIAQAGFDQHTADIVIQGESAWDPTRIGDNGQSFGLWQIHLFDSQGRIIHNISKECALDYKCSTEYAIKLLKSERSWNHWTIYRMRKADGLL